MEREITDQLVKMYSPDSIILHGSRASGHARRHSDWDYILLYQDRESLPANGRQQICGENVEFTHHTLPVLNIMSEFGTKLQNARVVYETSNKSAEIVVQAKKEYTQALSWTDQERYSHSLWMRGRIDGMQDRIDEPILFEKYAADFYSRITNYWYWAVCDRYPKPIYIAIEEIKEKDFEYYSLIQKFVEGDSKVKINCAEKIYKHCFGNRLDG